ncbi:MAG: BrnT family toxin [Caulobacter sp.]|nr:BrnT family toxin [Caulobacter sp.]
MRDDDFEWDDAKAAANLLRHGVSFSTARRVFDDPFAFEKLDDRMTYPEDRFATIALVDGKLLSVAWTERGERIRIISARFATAQERRLYHDQDF